MKRLGRWLTSVILRDGKPLPLRIGGVLLVAITPLIGISALGYSRSRETLTALAVSRRQAVAYLAGTILKAELDRHSDLGVSLATRVRFRQLIGEGRWKEAMAILEEVPTRFPSIERLFLASPDGTLMADVPALPGVVGRNFAFRDWYRGVRAAGGPYLSEIYRRSAEPRLEVVALAVPISETGGRLLGILVLQIRLETLVMWTRPARVEPGSVFYVVDRTGQIVAYPADPSARPALPSVRLPPVRNALLGEHGVEVLRPDASDEEWVYAYEPVAKTGWAVIAAQPSSKTFAVRNEALWRIGLASALVVLCSSALTGVILSALVDRHLASESIQKLNKSLERRAAELEEANHELDSFSYSVSHDLRAPLRSIDGFCRALREDCSNLLDDPGRDHIARLESASRRMGTLIEGLLSLARTTRVQLGEEQVDLAALARRIADELRRTDPQRRVVFRISEPAIARGDPRLLGIALENLLGNAWKFTRNRPVARIEFGTIPHNGGSAFFVRDDGAGFDPQYAHRLFGAFQRLHSPREFEGDGIGLATVARIVRRHGGRVWAEGARERGATFYFTV